jgi:hypothetical protein
LQEQFRRKCSIVNSEVLSALTGNFSFRLPPPMSPFSGN